MTGPFDGGQAVLQLCLCLAVVVVVVAVIEEVEDEVEDEDEDEAKDDDRDEDKELIRWWRAVESWVSRSPAIILPFPETTRRNFRTQPAKSEESLRTR